MFGDHRNSRMDDNRNGMHDENRRHAQESSPEEPYGESRHSDYEPGGNTRYTGEHAPYDDPNLPRYDEAGNPVYEETASAEYDEANAADYAEQSQPHYEERVETMMQHDEGTVMSETAEYRITMKDAIRIARSYIRDIYAIEGTNLPGLLLEEVELSETGEQWLITYGFDTDRLAERTGIFAGSQPRYVREYKQMAIDAFTGEVQSMKIRKV